MTKAGVPLAIDWNETLGPKQLAWFKNALNQAEESGERVVIFCHVPVLPSILEIIDAAGCVAAYFNGHRHKGRHSAVRGVHCMNLRAMVETQEPAYAVVRVYEDRLEAQGFGRELSRILPLP